MVFIGETKDSRLVLFGKNNGGYFYIEFTRDIESPRIEKQNINKETLLSLLEKNLDRYCQKGLNIVFEKMSGSD
jgi:hypothetical protein